MSEGLTLEKIRRAKEALDRDEATNIINKLIDNSEELRKALEAITDIYNNPKTGNLVALSAIGSIAKRALESK